MRLRKIRPQELRDTKSLQKHSIQCVCTLEGYCKCVTNRLGFRDSEPPAETHNQVLNATLQSPQQH